jgi:cobalt-zinc-cadmium efflux system outer membrane protein
MARARNGALATVLAGALAAGCARYVPAPIEPEETAATLAARSLDEPDLRRFLEAALGSPLPEWPPPCWTLATLTLAALYYQPSLDVARARFQQARAAIETAGQRPNPTLDLAPEWSSNPGSAISPWLAALHLDWPIETAGKRGRRIEGAEAQAQSARRALDTEAWQVRRRLRAALADLSAAGERIALLEQEVAAERDLVERTRQRVALGAASREELAPTTLAWIQSTAELDAARGAFGGARARVAAAVGVPVGALDAVEIAFPLDPASDPLASLDSARARRTALVERADVQAALADYAASDDALRLEIARQFPDLHLGSGYQFDQGQNKWSLGLSLELPLLNRNAGPIAEAQAARSASAARFVALQAGVLAQVEQALVGRSSGLEAARRMAEVARGQRARLERTRSAVALGAAERSAELAARIAWLRSRLGLVDARARAEQALGDLEAAVQGPLPVDRTPLEQSPRPAAPVSS